MSPNATSSRDRRPGPALAVAIAVGIVSAMPASAADADSLTLTITDTGQREYYCTATFEMAVPADAAIGDVNGYFYVFVGDEQVGRSKGASFRFPDGRASASATFETPNAPCADVDGYVFVVGACMRGGRFFDRDECASTITGDAPVRQVRAR